MKRKSAQKPHIVRSPGKLHRQISGEIAKFSGLYRVQHRGHVIKNELLVIQGTTFPFCPTCREAIEFHLVEKVGHIEDDPDFQTERRRK
jgi:hypothetical protein